MSDPKTQTFRKTPATHRDHAEQPSGARARHRRAGQGLTAAAAFLLSAAACGIGRSGSPMARPGSTAAASPPPSQATTPEGLARLVMARFTAGDTLAFDSVFPDRDGRAFLRAAVRDKNERVPGVAAVVRAEGDSAILILTGHAVFGNSGDETTFARYFSGLYTASREGGTWRLGQRVPIDGANRIRQQALGLDIRPGQGLTVHDTLTVDVGGRNGFWVFLNHLSNIEDIRVDGRPAEHRAGGGMFWVRAPAGRGRRITVTYSIDVAKDSAKAANSGRFEEEYGHVRNQYFWHPFFDFHSEGDQAQFRVTARAPRAYQVTTSLLQTDTVLGDTRVITGRTEAPTFGLTLLYDRGWQPVTEQLGPMRVQVFFAPDMKPPAAEVQRTIAEAYRAISEQYGQPGSRYLAVAQARARDDCGWCYRSNNLIVSGRIGGSVDRGAYLPRAWLGHEVAHGWTQPTGPGANFLAEGWASFIEPMLVARKYGEAAAPKFWESYRNDYETGGFEGDASIANDPLNGGIAYYKGSWILHSLEGVLGDSVFRAGMRAYSSIPAGSPAGLDEFVAAMSTAAGRDLHPFLDPWLQGTTTPGVEARVDGRRIILQQSGPLFQLPLELAVTTAAGTVRRSVQLNEREHVLTMDSEVRDVRIDPDHRFLMHRHRGDTIHFSTTAPGADKVELRNDFANQALVATRNGDEWSVDVPLTEGIYAYAWRVDGKSGDWKTITVAPLHRIEGAYPH